MAWTIFMTKTNQYKGIEACSARFRERPANIWVVVASISGSRQNQPQALNKDKYLNMF